MGRTDEAKSLVKSMPDRLVRMGIWDWIKLGINRRGLSTFKGLDEGMVVRMPVYPTLGRNEQVATGWHPFGKFAQMTEMCIW